MLPLRLPGRFVPRVSIALACLTFGGTFGCIRKQAPPSSSKSSSSSSAGPTPVPSAPAGDHTAALGIPSLAATLKPFFPIGAAVEPVQLDVMGDILGYHFNRLTTENAMKLGQVCARPNCDFRAADAIANFAREHKWQMTGHALVWHQMTPGWFFRDGEGPASTAVVSERLKAHTFRMVERYADVVDNWDVVNEAISDQPGKVYRDDAEGSQWHAIWKGEGYVQAAFEYAKAAAEAHAPSVKLYYNDYNVVNPEKRHKILEMVRALRKSGVRIDGVGMQAHWGLAWPSAAEIEATILELHAENLEVKISELDVSVYTGDNHDRKVWQAAIPDSPELEERLKTRYREIFEVLKRNHEHIAHVTFWGISDDKTWLNYWPIRRDNYPLLFDRRHQPKPALRAIVGLE